MRWTRWAAGLVLALWLSGCAPEPVTGEQNTADQPQTIRFEGHDLPVAPRPSRSPLPVAEAVYDAYPSDDGLSAPARTWQNAETEGMTAPSNPLPEEVAALAGNSEIAAQHDAIWAAARTSPELCGPTACHGFTHVPPEVLRAKLGAPTWTVRQTGDGPEYLTEYGDWALDTGEAGGGMWGLWVKMAQ